MALRFDRADHRLNAPLTMSNDRGETVTKAFERFLRSFSDEELRRFAEHRSAARPPYWRVMRLALQVEMGRRGLDLDSDTLGPVISSDPDLHTRRTVAS
jgi:hypothetical protein